MTKDNIAGKKEIHKREKGWWPGQQLNRLSPSYAKVIPV